MKTGVLPYFPAYDAIAKQEVYERVGEKHVLYTIRLSRNYVLGREIGHLLRRQSELKVEGSANVVKATSAAHRTPVHDADRWFCELNWVVDGIRE